MISLQVWQELDREQGPESIGVGRPVTRILVHSILALALIVEWTWPQSGVGGEGVYDEEEWGPSFYERWN